MANATYAGERNIAAHLAALAKVERNMKRDAPLLEQYLKSIKGGSAMNRIVYIKAIEQGENASGQILVKLVAANTDGIKPFFTSKKDVVFPEDIFPNMSKTAEKKPLFLQKVFHTKKH